MVLIILIYLLRVKFYITQSSLYKDKILLKSKLVSTSKVLYEILYISYHMSEYIIRYLVNYGVFQ